VTDAGVRLKPGATGDTGAALIARLERVPFSRWHLRARIVMGSATFFDAFDALSLAFVLPVLVRLWNISSVQIGWLIAAGYLGQFAGALLFGGMAERYGRVRSAAAATALMSVMSIACALAGNFPALLALRLVQGLGVGGEMPVAAVYINELSKAQGRGRFFLLYEMIFPVGLMVTGQVGALVVPTLGWQVMFLIGGIPGLAIAALLLKLHESPRGSSGRDGWRKRRPSSPRSRGAHRQARPCPRHPPHRRHRPHRSPAPRRRAGSSCCRLSTAGGRRSSGRSGRARTSSPTGSTTGCRRSTTGCTASPSTRRCVPAR
jgi:putative MFS transporter